MSEERNEFGGELNIAQKAAREAGKIIMQHYSKGHIRDYKLKNKNFKSLDVVTNIDCMVSCKIKEYLKVYNYGFLCEEGGLTHPVGCNRYWIIDPIDGTTNFIMNRPYFAVSIALQEVEDNKKYTRPKTLLGVIYDPLNDELLSATVNKGASIELSSGGVRTTKPCRLDENLQSRIIKEDNEIFVLSRTVETNNKFYNAIVSNLVDKINKNTRRLKNRCIGSAALDFAHVAMNRCHALIHHGLKLWDYAAGKILVQEAKGYVYELCIPKNIEDFKIDKETFDKYSVETSVLNNVAQDDNYDHIIIASAHFDIKKLINEGRN